MFPSNDELERRSEVWASELGLLPVWLREPAAGEVRVLLNGYRGNFCLDTRPTAPEFPGRDAWSSNVGHYLHLSPTVIDVYRWPGRQIERYSYASVLRDIAGFHRFLEGSDPDSSMSVVAHALRTFRQVRTALGPGATREDALAAFLDLLLSLAEEQGRTSPQTTGPLRSARTEGSRDVLSSLGPVAVDALRDEFTLPGLGEGYTLDIVLLLRHAAGPVFEDAHREVMFGRGWQASFPGFAPRPALLERHHEGVGIHFTPVPIARSLVQETIRALSEDKRTRIVVFDPACGSGEFLREAIRQLAEDKNERSIHLIGWDKSAAACEMTRFSLAFERHRNPRVSFEVVNCDSLETGAWPEGVDIVLMNPPFASYEDLSDRQINLMKAALGGVGVRRRPDLSFAFLLKASRCVASGGALGAILPSSVFDGQSAGPLRAELGRDFRLDLLGRLGSHQLFANALVDASMAVFATQTNSRRHSTAVWIDHLPSSTSSALRALRRRQAAGAPGPVVDSHFSIYEPSGFRLDAAPVTARPFKSVRLHECAMAGTNGRTVKRSFTVLQGARTGANKEFILLKDEYRSLPEKERAFFRPALFKNPVRDGQLKPTHFVFFPYGVHRLESEAELLQQLPAYFKLKLKRGRDALRRRNGVTPERWWELTRGRGWQVEPKSRLVSVYFGGPGSFAWDEDGDCVVVQGFAWERKRDSIRPGCDEYVHLAITNSETFFTLVEYSSKSVSGGQLNLSSRFLEAVPFPDIDEVSPEVREALRALGVRIHEKGLESVSMAELDGNVRAAYRVE